MKCKICEHENKAIFSAEILSKYDVKYYFCESCGFLQTEEPYWLKEAYHDSINISDTGIMSRNLSLSQLTTVIINVFFDKKGVFLDFAGGYGIFTRLMRDIGFDFYWNDKFSANLVARKFEYSESTNIELMTSFESFEHFDNPLDEIENMLKISKNILFSTELFYGKPPQPTGWGYYGFGHGQHISFYSFKTLQFLADKYNLNLYSNGRSLHLLTEKKLNPYLFNLSLKLNRFGLFHIVKKMNKSRTMSDWYRLK
jgi:hypothetical protein